MIVRAFFAVVAAVAAGPCSRRTPNTFSQAIRYSGTRAKVKANAATATATILTMPRAFALCAGALMRRIRTRRTG